MLTTANNKCKINEKKFKIVLEIFFVIIDKVLICTFNQRKLPQRVFERYSFHTTQHIDQKDIFYVKLINASLSEALNLSEN